MIVSVIEDYISATIVESRCGIASYYCSYFLQDKTSVLLAIELSKTIDTYANLEQLPAISTLLTSLVCERNFKLKSIDQQQYNDRVSIKIILKQLSGTCTKIHKSSVFSYSNRTNLS
jgi:hypothetical protein